MTRSGHGGDRLSPVASLQPPAASRQPIGVSYMEPPNDTPTPLTLRDRLTKSWFPPAAVLGALAALVGASLRVRPAPKSDRQSGGVASTASGPTASTAAASSVSSAPAATSRGSGAFERQYTLTAVLGGAKSADPFRKSLNGVSAGANDCIYALGDDEVRVYDAGGNRLRSWRVPELAACLAVGPDGRVYVGAGNRIEAYDGAGARIGGFTAGDQDRPADVTAIKVFKDEILVADAGARLIRRYDRSGRQRGVIGDRNKRGSFILPNRSLDIAVDAKGVVRATDTGRHQVSAWSMDGAPIGAFGKFGMLAPEDFVGCCNPVNIAVTPEGLVVTGEKMVARVKVFEPGGRMLALIGPEHFHPGCIHIHLAADSKGRILAADPASREVKIFSPVTLPGRAETTPDREKAGRS